MLAQSYDWLLFLTDEGLAEFISELLFSPEPPLVPVMNAFLASYTANKKKNRFTKVQIDYNADQALQTYFRNNSDRIEHWFNIITPSHSTIGALKSQISNLRDKDWKEIHLL